MNEPIPSPSPGRRFQIVLWIILIVSVFAILMGVVREMLHAIWSRAAIAACAFAILGLLWTKLRKPQA